MIICGTGHRPNKLGGYTKAVENKLYKLAYTWISQNNPAKVISGMALGWDQALAQAAVDLRKHTIAALPFENHHSIWPYWQIERYTKLLSECSEVVTVCKGGYEKWKMQERNKWMVDNSDKVLALWDGSVGGTNNCVTYALGVPKEIVNLWDEYSGAAKDIQI